MTNLSVRPFFGPGGKASLAGCLSALLISSGCSYAPPADAAVPRLSVSGDQILSPSGAPILLRGYNWNDQAAQGDGAQNAARGANLVRMTLWWRVDPAKTCASDSAGAKSDAYSPGQPGNIDPTLLAALDSRIAWARASGLWVDLAIHGGKCDFWTDPRITSQFVAMWTFLAKRYKDTPRIGLYELLSEPRPTNDKFNNGKLKSLYERVIAGIRSVDSATPIMVGPAPSYNIRNINSVYMADQKNVVYTANFYELGDYVKQAKKGPPPYNGYPGSYNDGRASDTSCVYPGKAGKPVYMDKKWLSGLLGCLAAFRKSHDVPIFVDQIGIRSAVPDSKKWASDVLDLLNAQNIGWAYWIYRMRYKDNSLQAGGTGVIWQDAGGLWHSKFDWEDMIGAHMAVAAPR